MRKNLLLAILISFVSLLVFWSPFIGKISSFWGINFHKAGMETVIQNFDGLNFLVVAKSMYDPKTIESINAQFLTGNDPIYFSAHFPVFPVVIKLFNLVLPLPYALLLTIILSNIALSSALYLLFETVSKNPKIALIATTIALFFPARILLVRGVGSNEPIFIFFTIMSLVFYMRGKDWASAIAGSLAVLTRSPGILLFFAYLILMIQGKWSIKKSLPYLLMPITLLGLFAFYGWRYSDLFAYFHSGDNLHLFFPPFMIFSNMTSWISDMWREDIIYLFIFYGVGLWMVDDKYEVIKKWGMIYGATLLFIAHRDLARYALPIAPIAIIGYLPILERVPKKTWYLILIILIPIYLFSWQFVLKNIQPISNWAAFL